MQSGYGCEGVSSGKSWESERGLRLQQERPSPFIPIAVALFWFSGRSSTKSFSFKGNALQGADFHWFPELQVASSCSQLWIVILFADWIVLRSFVKNSRADTTHNKLNRSGQVFRKRRARQRRTWTHPRRSGSNCPLRRQAKELQMPQEAYIIYNIIYYKIT